MERPPRLIRATSSPSRKTRVRKPSHLGSYSQLSPFGMPSMGAESIGSMSMGMGNFMSSYPQSVYILWTSGRRATISPADKPALNSTPRPHPSLGKLAQAGFPLLWLKPLQEVRDGEGAEVLHQHRLRGRPDSSRRSGSLVPQVHQAKRVVKVNVGHLAKPVGHPLSPLRDIALGRTRPGHGVGLGLRHGGPRGRRGAWLLDHRWRCGMH